MEKFAVDKLDTSISESIGHVEKLEIIFAAFPAMFSEACFLEEFNPFPNDDFLDSSKFKAYADASFEFDENGRKFSKFLENTVGKGEIAR